MKKKLLSVLLCGAMVASMLTACGEKDTPAAADTTGAATETEAPAATPAGDIPQDYKYYYSFDAANDSDAIVATSQTLGGDPILAPVEKDKVYIPGVKGEALYTDGITGYRLADFNGVGDAYTLSFWLYATRLANYMPSVQFGPDVHGDATGSQHYLNITRAEWTGEGTFPCVWAYDQADNGLWPNWADANTGEMIKQWVQVALVVDPNKVSADGALIEGDLYINGQKWIQKDSDGNEVPVGVVKGTMSPSDNFDMLLGINYWDSVFKGAFDELYVYDYCLDASQIAALYADGNPSVAYEEPERVIKVTAAEGAIASLGAMDFSKADDVYGQDIALADGATVQVKLKHWSDGKDAANNYYLSFKDADAKEVAVVNADMTGTANGKDIDASAFAWSWGNWNTWEQSVMVEADVTLNITRDGENILVDIDDVDYNKTSNTCSVAFTAPAESFTIGTKNAYTDILSIKDKTAKAGGIVVGSTDCASPFWTEFSDIFAVPEGETVTKTFYNYTAGDNNWENFLVILQNTSTGHSADVEGYKEYAVCRADNWGWGAGYDGIATAECDWNWDTFVSDIDGAHVTVSITNNGTTADIAAVATTVDGKTYHQTYTGIAVDGEVYACFTLEKAYLSFDTVTVGATDCSTPFWSEFSSIYAVPEGTSKTLYFKNYTAGDNNWENFLVALQNTPDAHSADADPAYKEYAVVRADNWGWGAGYDEIATADCDWDWGTFVQDIDGAYVELTVTNNGTTADIAAVVTAADGLTQRHQTYTGIAIDGDLYFSLLCEKSYLQIEAEQVGSASLDTGFWTKFSNIWAVPEGETVYKTLTNYTAGDNNWENFLVALQTTPTGHSADTEGYAEYAVVRADNWGWGAGYDGIATAECDWNWDTFVEDIDGAGIVLAVTNNGSTVDIVATITAKSGAVYHQSYTGIAVTGDVYFTILCEKANVLIQ